MSIVARRMSAASRTGGPTAASRTYLWGYSANGNTSTAENNFGVPQISRSFYSGGLPGQFVYPSGWTYDTRVWVSFKTVDSNTGPYAASCPPGTIMTFHHEPEGGSDNGDFASGSDFVAAFINASQTIKAANPNLPVAMIAGSYQYLSGKNGYDGSYIPPAEYVDYYTIDHYQANAGLAYQKIRPINQDDAFLRWRSLLPAGKPWGITEYGRGICDDTGELPGTPEARADIIPVDAEYFATQPDFMCWLYWWESDAGDGAHWAFQDQASIDAWKGVGGIAYNGAW